MRGIRRMRARVCACALVLAAACAARAAQPMDLPRVEAAPHIDGDLSDAAWQRAARATNFVHHDRQTTAGVQTTAFACHDAHGLYVAFTCEEPNTDRLQARDRPLDGAVNQDDCVELFVAPGTRDAYYHFLVNPANSRKDQRVWGSPRRSDNDWNGDWQSATTVDPGKAWTVEVAIPWHNFSPDLGRGRWRVQFCRARRTGDPEFASYSFVDGSFHNTEAFVALETPRVDLARYLGFELVAANLGERYAVRAQGYAYTAELVFASARDMQAEVQLEDHPSLGEVSEQALPVALDADEQVRVSATMPVSTLGDRTLKVRLVDADTGAPLYVNAVGSETFPNLFRAVLDRSYYTTEAQAHAVFRLNVEPGGPPLEARASVSLPEGESLSASAPIEDPDRTAVALPLDGVPLGTHQAALRVQDASGRELGASTFRLRREEPAPEGVREVKVDHDTLTLLIDGEPTFLRGIFKVPEEYLDEVAAAGFNMTNRWGGASGGRGALDRLQDEATRREWIRSYLDAVHEAGLYAMEVPCCFSPWDLHYANPEFFDNIDKFINQALPLVVREARDHPAVTIYFGPDEPGVPHYEVCRRFADKLREEDPYHPLLICYCRPIPDWSDVFDIAERHRYPRPYTPMVRVHEVVSNAVRRCEEYGVPCFHVPLMEMSSARQVGLTGPEQTVQGYLAVIAGARSLLWWVWPPRYVDNWLALKQLAAELRALEPVLVGASPPQEVRYTDARTRDSLKVLVKNHESRTFVIAANAAPDPIEATIHLPGEYAGEAEVWFEERTVPVRDGAFADRFEGHARHVYELVGTFPPHGRVTLDVTREHAPERAEAAEAQEAEEAPRENLILDPGFELGAAWGGGVSGQAADQGLIEISDRGRRTGDQGVYASLAHADSRAAMSGWQVRLEPNAWYVFGGYIRSVGARASLNLAGGAEALYLRRASEVHARDRTGWGEYRVAFKTRDAPVIVSPYCRVEGQGTAAFDDVFLYVQEGKVRNYVKNPGFERDFASLPLWPAHWKPAGIDKPGFLGRRDSVWAVDTDVVYEGERSLRMEKREGPRAQSLLHDAPNAVTSAGELAPGTYTLSWQMKADAPERLTQVMFHWGHHQKFTATDAWQQYTFTVTFEERADRFIRIALLDPGKLWIDAVQVEPGPEATAFTKGDRP